MADDFFGPSAALSNIGGGIFLAEVVNHLDQTYMGTIEVALFNDLAPNTVYDKSNVIPVRYMSPFSGVTSSRFEGNNSGNFNDVQKSYGMWMVPPDVGTKVMVIFPKGAGIGYWIGCVSDMYQNHMIPGIAASENVSMTTEQRRRYGTNYLPVAEFNKKTNTGNNQNISKLPKPVHPFADRLLAQGLILDTVRGVTSSSARREVPSSVFGISTPGPIDTADGAPRGKIGFDGNRQFPVSRLGGSTFVMDDGDQNGQNELVRIRTRTGHQILLHNSSDLIYIANSKGTAWIEMTSSGKIDIYAEDSVSIHTKGDFNLRADRDFNLEAGRNFNISSKENFNINIDKTSNIISDTMKVNIAGDYNLGVTGSIMMAANANISSAAGAENKISASGKLSIAGASVVVGAQGKLSVSGSTIVAAANRIDLNGPAAEAPATADIPQSPTPLNLFSNPQRDVNAGWSDNRYKGEDIVSIMQRIPSHEPWDQHENINPTQYSLARTDSTITASETASNGALIESEPSANTPYPAKNGPAGDRGTVQGQKFSWTTDQPFLTKIKEVCSRLGFDPLDLIGIMYLESAASMDPAKPNGVGFFGLIQFGDAAAKELKTSTAALAAMTRVGQMDYVERFFKYWGWPSSKVASPTPLANIYMTVFLPAFRFYGLDEVVCSANDPKTAAYYKGNPSFDPSPKKGFITPRMVQDAALVQKRAALQCLANAGVGTDLIVPMRSTQVVSGSGVPVTTGAGTPLTTGQ
jgi:hypothetical protein